MQGQRRELEVVAQPLAALRFAAGRFGLALVGASRVLDGAVNLVATCAAWLARADGAARRASWMPHRPHGAEAAAATGGPAVSAAPARPSPTAASDAKGGVSVAAEDASGANKWLPPSFREAARK
ncbi:hypothetical protein EMIHUDRAFT_224430 [Emiliania huxleyi CCMP1516]|uniref:Uncharacterized protein n=2 Tax=Emiliania huxleyi TaxID=2903 RepID=A0A0D3JN07_EMIH1|nr:hypothetical protein EMIHUDRAFT_238179 [Emiliania huxleyi CCMP1516]XP_005791067.1 hypothetical protein EMIHUDRAFT_224430 [Emiliania huxleyi CCMP1516]EOD24892.1 hypothetical protein EMIHUDRAFT_238179 [Emiliania huxleyi CCMP1516]EOD38638.1 hypothetical protein EMIHUDRAFT_224430 [Emiliania huxleyi CCMP1516]|eukprot:XP_005777321.1 hypothetical protein EMIHUDRAFT_238179 [Emiliania huxleyi CCMP1516]